MAWIFIQIALAVILIGLCLYPTQRLRDGFVVIGIVIAAAFILHFVRS
jgi:hypothetical protein